MWTNIRITYIPQTPISEITTEAAWLYNAIAKFFILPKYSVYNFRDEIPNEVVGNRRILDYIKKTMDILDKAIKLNDAESFMKQVEIFAEYLNYETKSDHCLNLFETISDEKYHPAFSLDELERIAITFHSSKGLEFEQVILFVSDYKLSKEEEIYNHYVATTRAKTKLIMVYIKDDWQSKQYAENITRILNESNLKMRDVAIVENCD